MADKQRPTKKVVKRVVKKPASPASNQPTQRYGRPVAAPPKPALKPAPPKKAAAPPNPPTVKKVGTKLAKKRVDLSSGLKSAGSTATRVGSAASQSLGRGARAASSAVGAGVTKVAQWRIPKVEPWRASVITGLLVGLLAVGLAVLAKIVFSEVRGVAGGGGGWGSLTFVVIAFVAFFVGERLLAAFGSKHAVVASLLGTVLAITAILALFLDASDTTWALLLVPVLAAATYTLSHWLLELADRDPISAD